MITNDSSSMHTDAVCLDHWQDVFTRYADWCLSQHTCCLAVQEQSRSMTIANEGAVKERDHNKQILLTGLSTTDLVSLLVPCQAQATWCTDSFTMEPDTIISLLIACAEVHQETSSVQ